MEGGEDLELSPSQKTSIRYQFESYCKKVLRGERCDYLREILHRADHELCFSDLPASLLERLCATDDYPMDRYVFELYGHHVAILNDRLGEALLRMGPNGRDILLLAYFLDLNDREISALLGTSRSTIQRHRQRSLEQMKRLLKE